MSQALRLYDTTAEQIHERISILTDLPRPEHLNLFPDSILALYELIAFIEEIPSLIEAKEDLPPAIDWVSNWSFVEFETARMIILKHADTPSLCMAKLAEMKGYQDNYLQIGATALDGILGFMNHYASFGLFDDQEPDIIEIEAGIDRLQLFGVYPIVKELGKSFGRLPREIENEPVGWVIKEWVHTLEQGKYQVKYNELSSKAK